MAVNHTTDKKEHWEKVYQTKNLNEVSWYQAVPETSLRLIEETGFSVNSSLIDIGGGDSLLTDHLLNKGYSDITVLDISGAAIDRAKLRLGTRGEGVQWIEEDVTQFFPSRVYDIWHDRAAFHFLTDPAEVEKYKRAVSEGVKPGGFFFIGTFAIEGPQKCSGLDIKQYDQNLLRNTFEDQFELINCFSEEHPTPFNTTQKFIFCSFRRKTL